MSLVSSNPCRVLGGGGVSYERGTPAHSAPYTPHPTPYALRPAPYSPDSEPDRPRSLSWLPYIYLPRASHSLKSLRSTRMWETSPTQEQICVTLQSRSE